MVIVIDQAFDTQVQTEDIAKAWLDGRLGLDALVVKWKSGDTTFFEASQTCDVLVAYTMITEAK
jgi:hypothetical protein